ncbi:hypothetical protein ES1_05020 [[Eubacterium] siraeum V10Sc8a]|uniref:Uncharacterized protein n=1 Tax=[Eubacterium] siraeum V10Sc8a TaxID=717961 RepID=D4MIQ2_9FIRM|nr:hypothetical protein ES1_05020 [[Eubacterium] siraeum V10Sc8a]DAQ86782.1 MAG TPA: hypothetical protein [Caudoviricetes sp.]DAS81729.1 MAG TPA: hypothetical protein [Caudoviricetes sp.]
MRAFFFCLFSGFFGHLHRKSHFLVKIRNLNKIVPVSENSHPQAVRLLATDDPVPPMGQVNMNSCLLDKEAADRNGEISVGTVVGFLYPFCS